jgi:hypothetical protein
MTRATLLRLLFVTLSLSLPATRAQASPESDFWQWFQRNEAMLFDFERDRERTFDLLEAEMRKVHPRLTFEFGPKEGERREFVISADGAREAFPKVESLFTAAPPLPKWKFTKFRPRREPLGLEYKGVTIKATAVTVRLQPDGRKAGLTVFIPGYVKAERDTYLDMAFLFLDQALGEYDVETRVGFIDVQAPPKSSAGALPLHRLAEAFDAFLAARR